MSPAGQTSDLLSMFQAGKEAHSVEQQKKIFVKLNRKLKEASKKDLLKTDSESGQQWNDIFKAIIINGFASDLAGEMNPDDFYDFGRYLLNKNENKKLVSDELIHEYLNLFRYPGFLQLINNQARWPELIKDLIIASNFNVAKLLKQRTEVYPQKSLFRVLKGNSDKQYTFQDIHKRVTKLSLNLLGFAPSQSEPLKIAFLMENSLNMVLLDLACLSAGIVNIMIPANSVPQQIEFILDQTGAQVILLGNDKQLAKVKAIKSKLPSLQTGVLLSGSSIDEWVITLAELKSKVSVLDEDSLKSVQGKIQAEQLASIMYTSGTTGVPKGIMFSQLNIVFKRFSRAMALPSIGENDRFLAYLPLYHTFGRWLEMMGSIFWAAEYVFMENPAISTMLENMSRVHPTIFISIPKKWMQLYEHVSDNVNIELDDEQKITDFVRQASGGRLKWGLSAAGYLEPDVFRFFQNNGIHLMSGFGMTEATGGITMTDVNQYRDNSLGRPLPGIEVKLADDGEMLIRGGYVMMGYYAMKEDESAFVDGWFPTGDIMVQDENGYYEIVDRKKEIYKNIKGETIAPQKIENLFRDFEYIQQIFLIGDHKPFNTVLIYPNFEHPDGVVKKMNDEELHIYFSSVVVTVNKFLAPFERILDFRISGRMFSTEKGELTPKGTYKRRVIEKNFDEQIQSMYEKSFISIRRQNFDIRIPNWFLREKGCLTSDIKVSETGIWIEKYNLSLTIEIVDEKKSEFRIGNYVYSNRKPFIDFQKFLANPFYWLGNSELIDFAGESIFQWYRLDDPDPDIHFVGVFDTIQLKDNDVQEFVEKREGGEKSLFGLNLAVKHLLSKDEAFYMPAVSYFKLILGDELLPIFPLANEIIRMPQYAQTIEARRALFITGLDLFKANKFEQYLSAYLLSDSGLIDEELSKTVIKTRSGEDDLIAIHNLIKKELLKTKPDARLKHSALHSLFNLLADFGVLHPTKYKRARQLIVRYQLNTIYKSLPVLASQARAKLLSGFRTWLGDNQQVSVDVETGKEYHWKDVVIFEESVSMEEQDLVLSAIANTSLIREAIFLFSKGKMVRLYDIPPGGVWISTLDEASDKLVYRVSVQTRYQGSFDIVLNHSKKKVSDETKAEMNWLIHAGAPAKGIRLIEDFGGFWEQYHMWTEDYYPGDTVIRFFERTLRKDSEENRERLYHIWPFFVRTAISAYVNFWRRTGYTLELVEMTSENIAIPPHDYQTGMRIISIGQRIESSGLSGLMEKFCQQFIKATEESYPFIQQPQIRNNLFAGILDSEGEEKGVELLKQALASFDINCEKLIKSELIHFLEMIERNGFIPRPMHFAIQRFHRWFAINSDASLSAQAQSLNEMFDTYQLQDLEPKMPETRTRFFLETVFKNSNIEIQENLIEIARQQHSGNLAHEEILEAISIIQKEFKLNEKEEYFLSRLSYPHLKPDDSALLLTTQSIADVVVSLEDYEGVSYMVRKPVSPKEISRLHQLYLEANLPVNFNPEHRFMVAVSERGFVIGGLFYKSLDANTAYMEKIVVSSHLRRKGISDGLMNEFFNRLRDEKITHVTTGFFRPEYFYRFGFKVERKYAGLVKDLKEEIA